MPRISVVIPNLNSQMIDQTLTSLRQQTFDLSQAEVLVVGLDGPGLVQEDALVRMISTSNPASPSVARNMGIRHAAGDIICFTDADCIAEPDWLAQFATAFADSMMDVVGGGVMFESDNYWTLCDNISWFHSYLVSARPGSRDLLPTLNLCVRREVIDAAGFLNEDYPKAAGEDAEWTTRMRQAGFALYFNPQAVIYHHPSRARFADIWRHAHMYGYYSVKVNRIFTDFLNISSIFRIWWVLLLTAPLSSLWATLCIFMKDVTMWRYIYALPGIWLSKVAWVLGAVKSLRQNQNTLIGKDRS